MLVSSRSKRIQSTNKINYFDSSKNYKTISNSDREKLIEMKVDKKYTLKRV